MKSHACVCKSWSDPLEGSGKKQHIIGVSHSKQQGTEEHDCETKHHRPIITYSKTVAENRDSKAASAETILAYSLHCIPYTFLFFNIESWNFHRLFE